MIRIVKESPLPDREVFPPDTPVRGDCKRCGCVVEGEVRDCKDREGESDLNYRFCVNCPTVRNSRLCGDLIFMRIVK